MSATKAPANRHSDKLLKTAETNENTVRTKPKPTPKVKTKPEVYPQVPFKKMALLGVIGIVAFFLSSISIGSFELYFLRIITFSMMTYIAFSYAMNITKYRDAPHNQPKPGPIKKSKALLNKYRKTQEKPLSMSRWARFKRWNARWIRAVGRWLRRVGRLTYCWVLVVSGVLATLYTAFASIYPLLKHFGLF